MAECSSGSGSDWEVWSGTTARLPSLAAAVYTTARVGFTGLYMLLIKLWVTMVIEASH